MGMKNAALALTSALAFVAGSANAVTYNLGSNPPDGTSNFALAKGTSTDTIKFSLSSATDFDFKLFSSYSSGGPVIGYFDLFDSTTKSLVDSGSYSNFVPAFTDLDLSKGNYYFSINDFATKPVTSPVLHLELSVSAVPEPQTYAIMLAGLAFFGVAFGRQRYVGKNAVAASQI